MENAQIVLERSTVNDVAYALFVSVTQGILSARAIVYFNQLYVQSKKKNKIHRKESVVSKICFFTSVHIDRPQKHKHKHKLIWL